MRIRITPLLFVLIGGLLIFGCSPGENGSTEQSFEDDTQSSNSGLIRVMSFNIRYDNPNDGENRWENRNGFVANMIQTHADIAGTQEGMVHQLEDLDTMLPNPSFSFDRVGVSRNDSEYEGEFCAIYYRTDKFELLEHNTFWLSGTPDEPGSVGWDAALPRIVTWAKFQDKSKDSSFYVFNTHFDHQGEEARDNSSRLILEKIEEIAGDDPVVVMGDFNATEDEEPYKILTEQLFDGFYHSKNEHEGPESTWNGFSEIKLGHRIDFIFANPQVSVVKHRILTDTRDGRFPSDHLPVQAEIKLKVDS